MQNRRYGYDRPYDPRFPNEGSYGRQGGFERGANRGPEQGGFDEQRENYRYGYRGRHSNQGEYGSENYDHPGFRERGHQQYRGHEPWNDHEERGRFRGYPSQGYMNMGPFSERKYGNGDWNIGNYGSRPYSENEETRYGREHGRRWPDDEKY